MKSTLLQIGSNLIELLKHNKLAKHNKIMLTRIRLPAKIPTVTGVLLIFLLNRKLLSTFSALSSSMKMGPGYNSFRPI